MASLRDIRRRIKSIRATAQITRAMQMVASSKMRKAQLAALAGRPYARLLMRLERELATHAGEFTHPLLEVRPVRKRAVVLVSTDKGLCGPLNSNLFREAAKLDPATTIFIAAGRKGAQFIARTRRHLAAEFTYHDTPQFAEARAIAKMAQELFLKGDVDRVDVLFTRFINTLTQRPVLLTYLPLAEVGLVEPESRPGAEAAIDARPDETLTEFLFEPSPAAVLGALLPHVLNFVMYHVLLEAKASEQSARMVAMKNATENANRLIADMTLEYNKMRQAGITKELLEITTAQMALSQ